MIAMDRRRLSYGARFAVTLVASLAFSSLAFADAADDLFDKGNAAYDTGNYVVAMEHFNAAWKLRKTHDLAATMAQAELKLSRYAEACTHLKYALAHFPLTGKPEMRKRMEEVLTETKKKVATVRLKPNVKEVTVRVDGSELEAEGADGEAFLSPGAHAIEARASGYELLKTTYDAKVGTSEDVPLTLVAARAKPQRSMVPAVIAFGVGGAGLVAGAVAGGIAAARTSELKKLCGDPIECPRSQQGALNDAKLSAYVSTAGFVLAGVGAVAGVTLLLVPIGGGTEPRASILIGPGFTGVKGNF